MVTEKMIIQYVKNTPASIVRPTIKYKTREKTEIWNKMTGISAAICAIQKADGWNKPKFLCLIKTDLPLKDSVTSDIESRELKRSEKKRAPALMKSPEESSGAL
jgi:hypothetical protein